MSSALVEVVVLIVGAGPAGLATSACLNMHSIPNLLLEREECSASLWRNRAYDRLKLHLGKQFCALPHMPFPSNLPEFVPRKDFINYLDEYSSRFNINPRYNRSVESASYDERMKKWRVLVKNSASHVNEVYLARFLVAATGENSEGLIPNVHGLDSFEGKYMHSNQYANGMELRGKDVLVVGCGNSGMEIAYDLYNWGANTSIVVRSPVHIVTKEIVFGAMLLQSSLPLTMIDSITVKLSKLAFGDISKYGFQMPKEGPFYLKTLTGRSPTIDVGAMDKIKTGDIKVQSSIITSIKGNQITFGDGKVDEYDVIIFATGYKSTVRRWLKDGGDDLFNENGMPKQNCQQWKGQNGLYCAGFARKGLLGIAADANNIATDIASALDKNTD
ncbi:probable indole-3-pyruvate monooxygenase YUCCA11 [Tripterygium wilfordii]|uniref:probable indole-3-pyruvate monooxygenase YUCCA11 n=1 Tax=Tripterygium wilfordii TaxID=458696 RepID=UPI0018F84A1A|nr:probable indole-3-pyruvate monooxygenase YUCCA11 [Tripterygium wilfordii]